MNKNDTKTEPDQPVVYEIRVRGHLGREWTDWFEGLTITPGDGGDTLLSGPVVDQAALHGLMRKVRDLGLPLVSVNRIEAARTNALDVEQGAETSHSKRRGDEVDQ
ncbi:hypothetical protein [Rubrobacter aplysinae]|uniref:hypothetical protein n=1 Tax=Rubrobacter aplysinae TaxID=909625 RepID=UPI00064C007A|nr:hypothetical protein [Rubrobacter aplysinae]